MSYYNDPKTNAIKSYVTVCSDLLCLVVVVKVLVVMIVKHFFPQLKGRQSVGEIDSSVASREKHAAVRLKKKWCQTAYQYGIWTDRNVFNQEFQVEGFRVAQSRAIVSVHDEAETINVGSTFRRTTTRQDSGVHVSSHNNETRPTCA